MAQNKAAASFQEMIQADRQKRKNEQLAQEIFGKNRRQSAPVVPNSKKAPLGGSLASRVGVTKRTASVPRSNSTTHRNARNPTKPPPSSIRPSRLTPIELSSDPAPVTFTRRDPVAPDLSSISFKGAAGGPYIVHASNFAPGTTAADIESVMKSVPGVGEMLYCRLLAAQPTVIVEMSFAELAGAGKVVETFNNKKADGRLLHVYMKDGGTAAAPMITGPPVNLTGENGMEIDDISEAREAENRLREERRGRDSDRERRPENEWPSDHDFPAVSRGGRGYGRDDYYRGSRPAYQNGGVHSAYRGGGGYGGGRPPYGRGAGYGGQNYRP